jgi:replicative DNA helicase
VRSIYELLGESMDLLETLYDRSSAITGVPTGFHDLDRLLAGLQPSSLVIIGARPAMGKTSLALSMATHAAKVARVPTLVFSLEMSHMEITQRILSAEARVDATHLRTGSLSEVEWHQVQRAVGHLGEAPIFVDDNPHLTVMDVRAKARRLKASENLGLVVIDYLQLMSGRHSAENRQVEISEISRGLKILARELSVPVVALSQLSRNLENRSDKRPVLADLRESGSLEQDADVVMFIYRDEVYNPETAERGMAELLISKHRNGPTGAVQLVFHDKFARFANMARP